MQSQNHAADALVTQGATASATMVLTLLSLNKTCKSHTSLVLGQQTHVHGTCEHFFVVDNFNFCRAEFVYEIQKYVYTLCHSHHWYCAGNLYHLYWKVSSWILVAEDPSMQGTRALTATVLTQLSRNLSVSAPEGLRIVYITCRVSRYRDTFLSSYCLRKKNQEFL